MDEFEALVHSLGENTVDYLGKDRLRHLAITADPVTGTAHVEICLQDDSWASRERAIETMVDIRRLFLDDIAIEYAFSDESCMTTPQAQVEYQYA